MTLTLYTILTLLVVLTAAFSYLNARYIRLQSTIGIMLISLVSSFIIVVVGKYSPGLIKKPVQIISSIHFETLLMRVMLSFLLFAGAIHVDLQKLKKELGPIIAFSTLGTLLSTGIVGILMFLVFKWFAIDISLLYCLVFGALISPTDPVAVLGILKEAKIPSSIETKIAGESLFNDGVGVVIFVTLLEIAGSGVENQTVSHVLFLFLREAGGGLLWGWLLGYAGFYLLRSIDQYQVEVLITVAMVMGGYLFAQYLEVSGPLAMVVAGIITGNKGRSDAFSETSKDYLGKFWNLLDEMLNAFLFLLIGLEMIVFTFSRTIFFLGLAAILVTLIARLISVFLPTLLLSFRRSFERNLIPILTWGGLRGGISVALALSLPRGNFRNDIVSITYIIVVFSILVQGITIGRVAGRLSSKE